MRYNRVVVKVGTSTLTHETGALNLERMDALIRTLNDLMNGGTEVILVSSGAIGAGVGRAKLPGRPASLREKQAAAAIGQCSLIHIYDKLSSEYGHGVAQLLLTALDLSEPVRRENVRKTLDTLIGWGVLPIINANDAVSTEEIETPQDKIFSENDTLSALVAVTAEADLLVLLTDIPGLYDADPRANPDAKLIARVSAVTPQLRAACSGAGTHRGTGGMITKLDAGVMALRHGIDMIITHGENPAALYDAVYGRRPVGTLFSNT
ncbi:MAG: glutamate 5-kinase [Oscillospiraceae bacterium]|nr:glutamate 5-kinase [Oscillospiraceae bacterium]